MNYLQRLPSLGGNELCQCCSDKASIIRLSHKHPLCNSVIKKTVKVAAVERSHTNAQRGDSECVRQLSTRLFVSSSLPDVAVCVGPVCSCMELLWTCVSLGA